MTDNIAHLSADRVHMVARDAKVMSHMVVSTMRTLGYQGIKSPSSRVDLAPIEREALIATVDAAYPRHPENLIRAFFAEHPDIRELLTRNPERK